MENNNTSVMVNLLQGIVSITGTAEFIEKNMTIVFDFVEKNLSSSLREQSMPLQTKSEHEEGIANITSFDKPVKPDNGIEKYIQAGVFHVDAEDGSVSILKRIPGSNKAEKTKNIALIVLYIKGDRIQGKELVPICEKHSCYDSSNFAATFKNEMSYFIRKGSGQSWTLELTQPGLEAAQALLEEMINDKK